MKNKIGSVIKKTLKDGNILFYLKINIDIPAGEKVLAIDYNDYVHDLVKESLISPEYALHLKNNNKYKTKSGNILEIVRILVKK